LKYGGTGFMKNMIIAGILMLIGITVLADNPFGKHAADDFKGAFTSYDLKIRLTGDKNHLFGQLYFLGEKYDIAGVVEDDVLSGYFKNKKNKIWPCTLKRKGYSWLFTAGKSKTTLIKLPPVSFPGNWRGNKIKICIEDSESDKYNGKIIFNDEKYPFSGVSDHSSIIVGSFSKQGNIYGFSIMQGFETDSIEFISDAYSITLKKTDKHQFPSKRSEKWTIPDLKTKMIYIKSGSFRMGAYDGEADEKPIHNVRITNGYWMGKYEVTQHEYRFIMKKNPSRFKSPDKPVEHVSWSDAVSFCNALTDRERRAGRLPDGYEYRLPTEAEWEFAARGGRKTKNLKYSGSKNADSVAWYESNAGGKSSPVGKKSPNELGIHDMSGNVWEWCYDDYKKYHIGSYVNPVITGGRSGHVNRGGSWYRRKDHCRVTNRENITPNSSYGTIGFRIVLARRIKAVTAPVARREMDNGDSYIRINSSGRVTRDIIEPSVQPQPATLRHPSPSSPAQKPPAEQPTIQPGPSPTTASTRSADWTPGNNFKANGLGSGFFIDSSGYVVTNFHVIGKINNSNAPILAKRIQVKTASGQYNAKVVAYDSKTDMAVLKVQSNKAFSAITLSSNNNISPGSTAFTIGFPRGEDLGWQPKVTKGIISSTSGFKGNHMHYQTTVQSRPGNSGGMLADKYGNGIGIICSIYAHNKLIITDPETQNTIMLRDYQPTTSFAIKNHLLIEMLKKKNLGNIVSYAQSSGQTPDFKDIVKKCTQSVVLVLAIK
jgi:formylglycine-generating enzyme required for sulfatase activity